MKKVVIKVCMNGNTSRFCCFKSKNPHSKVLGLAGGFPGVQSVALVGDRDQIEVTGELDAVNLTILLRKKVGFVEIVSMGEAKKEDKSKDPKKDPLPIVCPYPRQEIFYVQPDSWCWPL